MERVKQFKTKTEHPILQYNRVYAAETVQEIYDGVNTFACVGKVVSERVTEISKDLKNTLKYDYALIKPEMERYEKYGEAMKSMTDVFVDEFTAVFTQKAEDLNDLIDDIV